MKNNKRILPTEENPRYGEKFCIRGIQIENIDNQVSEMSEIRFECKDDGTEPYYEVGSCWKEWMKNKEKLSDEICSMINPGLTTPWKRVVAFRIKYFMTNGLQVV